MSSERAYIIYIYIHARARVEETQSHVRGLLTNTALKWCGENSIRIATSTCLRRLLPSRRPPTSEERGNNNIYIGLWTNDAVDPTSSFTPGGTVIIPVNNTV